jgi:hypothetical protein
MVDAKHRVDDETAWTIGHDEELTDAPGPAIMPGSVIVVLESPHKSEFDGCGGVALGPLRLNVNRQQFRHHAPDLLRQAADWAKVDLAGRPLVLANSVQYQTSLQALRTKFNSRIDTVVRDAVWTELFIAGGDDDLVRRLAQYRPALVLLASTRFSVPLLTERLSHTERDWPILLVNEHPSCWWRYPPMVIEGV